MERLIQNKDKEIKLTKSRQIKKAIIKTPEGETDTNSSLETKIPRKRRHQAKPITKKEPKMKFIKIEEETEDHLKCLDRVANYKERENWEGQSPSEDLLKLEKYIKKLETKKDKGTPNSKIREEEPTRKSNRVRSKATIGKITNNFFNASGGSIYCENDEELDRYL
mmetsp:Transcript_27897/g.24681  ORF Transcript_27897/g.24681 Transcript_27897/m.24681 type:complete len:166 (-) Transcript_27897:214-711(-)